MRFLLVLSVAIAHYAYTRAEDLTLLETAVDNSRGYLPPVKDIKPPPLSKNAANYQRHDNDHHEKNYAHKNDCFSEHDDCYEHHTLKKGQPHDHYNEHEKYQHYEKGYDHDGQHGQPGYNRNVNDEPKNYYNDHHEHEKHRNDHQYEYGEKKLKDHVEHNDQHGRYDYHARNVDDHEHHQNHYEKHHSHDEDRLNRHQEHLDPHDQHLDHHQDHKQIHHHDVHKHNDYKTSKPKGLSDLPLRSHLHSNVDISPQVGLRGTLFTPAGAEHPPEQLHQSQFNTQNTAPNSVFHTQVNVDSPGGQFNVANNFPRGVGLSGAASEMDVVMVPARDIEQQSRLLEVIYTPESSKPVQKQVQLDSNDTEVHNDGYHYDRPSVSFEF